MENKFVLPIFGKASLIILLAGEFKLFLKVVEAKVLLKKLLFFVTLLLSVANDHNEVEYILTIEKGIIPSLNFIKENIDILLTMEKNFFPINLGAPNDKDVIDDVYILINEIMNKTKDNKYNIINIEDLFDNLLNFAYYKDLKELYKLNKFVPFITKERKGQNLINNFYKKIHEKGMNLIRNNKLTTDEIFNFIMKQDLFYCNPINCKSYFRDPEIFKYIPLIKRKKDDNEYLKNIEIIKNNKLFEIFSEQSYSVQKRFQEIILEQMKKMSDLKSVFDIFPRKFIDQGFTFLINGIVDKLKYTILDEAQ